MNSIFISYRRAGTSGYGGRLQEDLRAHFGQERVFRDIDSIRPGTDFADVIHQAVARSGVVLALIGRNWTTVEDASGRRRLDDPADFVRLELEAAFDRRVTVIPVLVEEAKVPSPEELPTSLARLSRIQGIELSDERWDYDVGRLVGYLEDIVGPAEPDKASEAMASGRVAATPAGAGGPTAGASPTATGGLSDDGGTDDTAPPIQTLPAGPPGPEPASDSAPFETKRGGVWRFRWVGAAVVVLLVAIALALVATRSGGERPLVPAVVDHQVTAAVATLESAGFAVKTQTVPDGTRQPGTVSAQQPAAGSRVEKGTEVFLTVAEVERVAVPDVVNRQEAEAAAILVSSGLLPAHAEEPSNSVAPGLVISTAPAPGTLVGKATTVTLTVSTGRRPRTGTPTSSTPHPTTTSPTPHPTTTSPTSPVTTSPVTSPPPTPPPRTSPRVTAPVGMWDS